MRKLFILLVTIFIGFGFLANRSEKGSSIPEKLSDYGFFAGELKELDPAEDVLPYRLVSPLFSDYAEKARFIKIPKGQTIHYNDTKVFEFPVGTVLIKTFFYYHDARKPEKGRQLLETRLLVHEENGWKALPYIWDDAQTDAYLDVAGDKRKVSWRDARGKKRELDYSIPNMNQCKGCHSYDNALVPIGPSARQLNGEFAYKDGSRNQLLKWKEAGLISGLPEIASIPQIASWQDSQANLDHRARAYLDINCAHCHNRHGPANTSGLFLHIQEDDPAALGVMKAPIAAGRGSGGRQYSIEPGKPDASILLYRMESADPGVMMPELSRKLVHEEGVALIRDWIKNMGSSD